MRIFLNCFSLTGYIIGCPNRHTILENPLDTPQLDLKSTYTYIHTHTYIYIYIYVYIEKAQFNDYRKHICTVRKTRQSNHKVTNLKSILFFH